MSGPARFSQIVPAHMAFRNENVALRTKVQELQREIESLRGEREDRDEPSLTPVEPSPPRGQKVAHVGDDVAALVAHREAEEAEARRVSRDSASRKREETVARLKERPRRVHVEHLPGKTRVHIEEKLMRDAIREDAEWHFFFFLINPGIFIVGGLAGLLTVAGVEVLAAICLALVTWVASLALGNVVKARLYNPRHTLELLGDGHFALYRGGRREPALFGSMSQLSVRLSDPDDADLGWVKIGDGRVKVELTKLCPADVAALRTVLR